MSLYRSLVAATVALALGAALVPAFAFAQVYTPSYNCNQNTSWYYGTTNTVCTPGSLLVYVQVTNNLNNGYNQSPSNFTVAVSGLNANPSTFPGSLGGTQVSVAGSYSVTALQLQGYSATYSTGCTGTLSQGENALCVVTESNSYNSYSPYPTPYGYGYNAIPLSCTPSYQTVNLGQTVTFNSLGGDYSQYNWQTPQRSYLNVGQTLNVQFTQTGTQTVTVTNGTDTAQCTVNVVASGAPIINPISPVTTTYPYNNYTTSNYGGVYVTPTYIPLLPNTGFAPLSEAEAASAVALIIAAALVALPYVRKAFAVVLS